MCLKTLSIAGLLAIAAPCLGQDVPPYYMGRFEDASEVLDRWVGGTPSQWRPSGTRWELSPLHTTEGRGSLKIVFQGHAERDTWPMLEMWPKQRDWSGYDALHLDAYNSTDDAVMLKLRIAGVVAGTEDTKAHAWPAFRLPPRERVHCRVAVPALAAKFDPARTESVCIFLDRPKRDYTIFIDAICLRAAEPEPVESAAPKPRPARFETAFALDHFAKGPKIDGSLADLCWQRAKRHGPFLDAYRGLMPTQKTFCYIGCDRDALYIAADCRDNDVAKLSRKHTEHDAAVYQDDCIEVFIDPHGARRNYFQFISNCIGTRAELKFEDGDMDSAWTPPWEAAAEIGQDRWTLEMRIPFAILELDEACAGPWVFEITREQHRLKELTALVPTFAGFHFPAKWGTLDRVPDLSRFHLRATNFDPGARLLGQNTYSFRLQTARPRPLRCLLRLGPTGATPREIVRDAPAARDQTVRVPYVLESREPHAASIELVDPADGAAAYTSSAMQVEPVLPVRLRVLKPHYANDVFPAQSSEDIRLEVWTNLEDGLRRAGKLEVSLARDSAALRSETLRPIPRGRVEVALKGPRLPVGEYAAVVRVVDAAGRPRDEVRQRIRVLAKVENVVRIDEHNRLVINGKPCFPIGIFQGVRPEDLPRLKSIGMNLVQKYSWYGPKFEKNLIELLDAVHANGMHALVEFHRAYTFLNADKTPEQRDAYLRDQIQKYGQHPAVAAWYFVDEADYWFKKHPQYLRSSYESIKTLDPYHPVVNAPLNPGSFSLYGTHGDIISPDPYLGYIGDGPIRSMQTMATYTRKAVEAVEGRKPVWIVPQLHNMSLYECTRARERNPHYLENRCQVMLCVINRAMGIVWYNLRTGCHEDITELPHTWHALEGVVRELNALSPVLLDPSAPAAVSVSAGPVQAFARLHQGHAWLIAANASPKPSSAAFTAKFLGDVATLTVAGEGRTVRPAKSRFADSFGPYGVHVYTSGPAPRWIDVAAWDKRYWKLRREFNARAARNLLAGDRVVIRASSSKWRLDSIADGMKASSWRDDTPNEFPDWLRVDFAEPVTVGRMVLHCNLTTFDVQQDVGGKWRDLKRVKDNADAVVAMDFSPAISGRRFRLLVHDAKGVYRRYSTVGEWEVYPPGK